MHLTPGDHLSGGVLDREPEAVRRLDLRRQAHGEGVACPGTIRHHPVQLHAHRAVDRAARLDDPHTPHRVRDLDRGRCDHAQGRPQEDEQRRRAGGQGTTTVEGAVRAAQRHTSHPGRLPKYTPTLGRAGCLLSLFPDGRPPIPMGPADFSCTWCEGVLSAEYGETWAVGQDSSRVDESRARAGAARGQRWGRHTTRACEPPREVRRGRSPGRTETMSPAGPAAKTRPPSPSAASAASSRWVTSVRRSRRA